MAVAETLASGGGSRGHTPDVRSLYGGSDEPTGQDALDAAERIIQQEAERVEAERRAGLGGLVLRSVETHARGIPPTLGRSALGRSFEFPGKPPIFFTRGGFMPPRAV